MRKTTSKKTIIVFLSILFLNFIIFPNTNIFGNTLIDETKLITENTLKFLTPPADFRSYYMLQSIDDTTVIVVGNFVNVEKVITLIVDKGSDNTIDAVVEYYPDTKKYNTNEEINIKFY